MTPPAISRVLSVFYAAFSLSASLPGSSGATAQFSLFMRSDLPIGPQNSVAIADLNRDGKADLATAFYGSTVSVFLGNGDGTFLPPSTFPTGGSYAVSVISTELNGDGNPDLLVGNGNQSTVSALLGAGDGSFGAPLTFATSFPKYVRVADLNKDGRLDAVVDGVALSIHLGNGDGTFGPRMDASVSGCPGGEILSADFNVDGRRDLAVGNPCPFGKVSVLLGNGDGTFQPQMDFLVQSLPDFGDVGDLNGDGSPDLVVTNMNSNSISVMLGNGDGTFLPRTDIEMGWGTAGVRIGDLNSDGIPDIAATSHEAHILFLLAGRGDGTFEPKIGFPTSPHPYSLQLGDLTGDGLLDIVTPVAAPLDGISIFLNATGPPAGNPPLIEAPASLTTIEGAPVTFTVTASDPDGDAITRLAVDVGLAGQTFTTNASNTSGTFSWTACCASPTPYSVVFTAQNFLASQAVTRITVRTAVDRAPVVTAPLARSELPGSLLTFTVSASDPDGDAITSFTAAPLPSGATFTSNATNTLGTFSWTPSSAQTGTFAVTFTAANALSGSATTNITIGDRAPVVTAPATRLACRSQLLTFTVLASDPDGDAIASLTASGTALTAGATFTAGAGNTSGTLNWTPTFTAAGTYGVTFTALNDLSGSASTSISVTGCDRPPTVFAPATASGVEGSTMAFTVTANDPDGQAITSFTASGTAITAGATFTAGAGNTSGTLSWTPTFTQAGTYSVTFTASNTLTGFATTSINVGPQGRPPMVTAPVVQSACVGLPFSFTVAAADPDGEAIASLTASGSAITAGGAFTSGAGNTSGTFSWTPSFSGSFQAIFTASNDQSGSASTTITVDCGVLPAVTAPAAVSGTEGSLITFTVTATEPDGPALVSLTASGTAIDAGATFTAGAPGGPNMSGTFDWTPTLTQAGTYSVTFTATSNNPGTASTSITVADADSPLAARAFTSNANRTIRLASGKAFWCASIEPIDGSFDVANIVPTSVVLISPGTGSVGQISADVGKFVLIGDADKNDVQDVNVCFRKEDLRLLFSDVNGKTTLTVTLAGSLTTGRQFGATLSIEVVGSGGGVAASVAPNPLNPSGVLTFTSTRPGVASVRLFDHTGRLVRTLEQGTLPAGRHELRIDGRDDGGRPLATGIYFYRVDLVGGTATGRFALLK